LLGLSFFAFRITGCMLPQNTSLHHVHQVLESN